MGSNLLTIRTGLAIKERVEQNQGIMRLAPREEMETMQQE